MRFTFLPSLVFCVMALPGSIGAQEGKKPVRLGTAFQPASKTDLQHGRVVEVTTKGSKIKGSVVRVDQANDRVFIRTSPKAAPTAIAMKDIEKVDKEVQFGLSKDNVKLVGTESDVISPEIQSIEMFNGTRRTTTYSAPTLSPGELSLLQNLQEAEAELARLEQARDRENQVIDTALSLQAEQLRTIALRNHYQGLMNTYFGRMAQRTTYWSWWDADYTVGSTSSWQLSGMNNYYSRPQPNVIEAGPPIVMPTITPVPQDSLTKARQNVLALRAQTVFENNRLVAVVPEK